jgi:hypothetical protein
MGLPEGVVRAEGMTGVIIFAVVYAIVAILGKVKEASRKSGAGSPPPQPRPQRPRTERPVSYPPPGNTQAEATKLEELLRVLGEAAGVPTTEGTIGRPARTPLPSAEDVEERESLEREEEVLNLETEIRRPSRREVDHDEEAEAIVQRRIRAAAERDRSLNRADHKVFDSRIRPEVPDNTRVAKPRRPSLRDAMVWREILGPPISLRDRPDL